MHAHGLHRLEDAAALKAPETKARSLEDLASACLHHSRRNHEKSHGHQADETEEDAAAARPSPLWFGSLRIRLCATAPNTTARNDPMPKSHRSDSSNETTAFGWGASRWRERRRLRSSGASSYKRRHLVA